MKLAVTTTWTTSTASMSFAPINQGALNVSKNRPFTFSDLSRMTNNFKSVIGEGGFGKVYLGNLEDGYTKVAVKMLSKSSKQGYKEFHAEAELLRVVHHRNLVSFIGYCDEFENMALVYEYMNNGDLKQHLSAKNLKVLSWGTRLQIAVDAAQGLEYLHNGCKPPIIHRDLKTSNILLSGDMQAKIADFGLSKAFESDHETHISTRPAGTPGYLDPEFHASGNLTKKSDVYSFGVILLEIIMGQPAITRGLQGNIHILHLVTPLLQRGDIQSIVDPRLNGDFDLNSAWKAVEIAMSCVSSNPSQRPDMSLVLSELKECLTGASNNPSRSRMGNEIYRKVNDSFEMNSIEFGVAPNAR